MKLLLPYVTIMQVLPLKGITQTAASLLEDGSALLLSGAEGTIYRLDPVPFEHQAEVLADAEEFQEALQLASYIPDSEVAPPPPNCKQISWD